MRKSIIHAIVSAALLEGIVDTGCSKLNKIQAVALDLGGEDFNCEDGVGSVTIATPELAQEFIDFLDGEASVDAYDVLTAGEEDGEPEEVDDLMAYPEDESFMIVFYLVEDQALYSGTEVDVESVKDELNEGKAVKGDGNIDGVDTPFKNFKDWEAQAKKMKLKVSASTSPDGDIGVYWRAYDREGNNRGEFLAEGATPPATPTDDDGQELDEIAKRIAVNHKGIKRIKMQCPKGFRYDAASHSCVKIGGAELANHRKAMVKALTTRKAGGEALKKRAAVRTKKAMKFRAAYGLGKK